MLLGPNAYICDECIAICNNIIEDENYDEETGYEDLKSEDIPTPAEIKKILDSNCCRVKSIHPFSCGMEPFMIFSNYYRRFEDSLKFYENYYKVSSTDLYISSGLGESRINFRIFNKPSINFYRINKIETN